MTDVEAVDTQDPLLWLILFVVLDDCPFLQCLTRQKTVKEVLFSFMVAGISL